MVGQFLVMQNHAAIRAYDSLVARAIQHTVYPIVYCMYAAIASGWFFHVKFCKMQALTSLT
jgi:hypothetical protein